MMRGFFRRHLGAKLFLSYLVVILICVLVLAAAAELVVPRAFDRHMAGMGDMVFSMMGGNMMQDVYVGFRAAVTEALVIAALSAAAVAVVVSIFVSRRVAAPVGAMMLASQRIASGHYSERVQVQEEMPPENLDELERLAASFNNMAAALEKTEAQRRELIGDVTHELRTPLTTIKGYMEGLLDGVLPETAETYQAVYREADRLKRLVDDLQELSRVEAGAYPLNIRPVDLPRLVGTLTENFSSQFREKNVRLVVEIPADLPRVLADEDRLKQILTNLVGNALQYTPEGGEVHIEAGVNQAEVEIRIADTGIGIAAEHLSHLFTRFYRVDKSRSRAAGGSGIGLTITRYLVDAQGGRIWATSPGEGLGSVFVVALPSAQR